MADILLDVDGVLGDFAGSLLQVLRDAWPETAHLVPTVDDITSFNMRQWLPDKTLYKRAISVLNEEGFARYIYPIEGAVAAVNTFRREGHGVYVVTSPWISNPTWEYDRRLWLKKHFDIDEDQVISTTVKYRVRGDAFIDDRPKHVKSWALANTGGYAYLFRHQHNRSQAADFPCIPGQTGYTWNDTMVQAILEDMDGF